MMTRPFHLVDVFHDGPATGNPLAVVSGADDLSTGQMQHLTRWFNLSESTFLLPPTNEHADYRVRIFTLDRELPFAGHPTLGTCHAWLAAGGVPRDPARIIQQCDAGLVPVRRDGERLAFRAPPLLRTGPVDEALVATLATFLRVPRERILDTRWIDNGPGWVGVRLASAEEVLALEPAPSFDGRLDLGVVGPHAPGSAQQFELRAFFSAPDGSIREDPVTGSLNASAAAWLRDTGQAQLPYVAAQGTRLGCRGRIWIAADDDGAIWVGGRVATMVQGDLAA
jgi:PhzF family phenazine biosynthesis protein